MKAVIVEGGKICTQNGENYLVLAVPSAIGLIGKDFAPSYSLSNLTATKKGCKMKIAELYPFTMFTI